MPLVVTCGVISAVVVVVVQWRIRLSLVAGGRRPLSVYLSTLSLGGDARSNSDRGS